ncbi:MAG: S9 family peptidase [Armatimonadota bacterium]|nr:S9 family peptidase [Armatimonadota bacterium]MDR7518576.1 S9 family peptidase [Armatimonadota bacterium]MDR7549695.1 S9 family peptidase [Armatimonadota bacterium]
MPRRPVEIDDLLRVRFPHAPALSPDGRRVVCALGRLDHEANDWRSQLWVVPTAGGPPVPFTADEARDTQPVWAPDGRWIAFLSNRGGKRRGRRRAAMQLWLIPSDGGEARQVTFFAAGVGQPAWSPDGRTLAFVTRGTSDRREPEAADREDEVIVREITRGKYKFDGVGFLEGYAHVWTVAVDGGEPVRLTDGEFDHEFPAWLPSGREIVFVANRSPDADFSFVRDLWAVDVQTRALRRLTRHAGPATSPVPSPDGRWVAFAGHDFHAKSATNMGIWVVPGAGGDASNLTAAFDRSVGNAVGSDVRITPQAPSIAWTADGAGLVFYATDRGSTHLYRVALADRTIAALTEGEEVIADLSASAGQVVYQRLTPTTLDELWLLPEVGGPRRLTAFNDDLLAQLEVPHLRRFTFEGVGGWPMEGWIRTPASFDSRRKHPAVLRIHGGPHAAFGHAFSHYAAVLVSRGYVVVETNPRGSQGYGEAFTQAVIGDWGGDDSQDILLGLDAAIAQGFIDPDRVAVAGGSYGGFMTNWLIGHTGRFRCAVSEVSVSNLHSFYGTSDIGATWGEVEWGASPWDDPQRLLAHSPLMSVTQVTTPVLITANEADHRCPVEQSEQFYVALRKLGREAVFLRFQDESHTMASGGRPRPRIERLRRLAAWFDRFLRAEDG